MMRFLAEHKATFPAPSIQSSDQLMDIQKPPTHHGEVEKYLKDVPRGRTIINYFGCPDEECSTLGALELVMQAALGGPVQLCYRRSGLSRTEARSIKNVGSEARCTPFCVRSESRRQPVLCHIQRIST